MNTKLAHVSFLARSGSVSLLFFYSLLSFSLVCLCTIFYFSIIYFDVFYKLIQICWFVFFVGPHIHSRKFRYWLILSFGRILNLNHDFINLKIWYKSKKKQENVIQYTYLRVHISWCFALHKFIIYVAWFFFFDWYVAWFSLDEKLESEISLQRVIFSGRSFHVF